MNDVMDWRMVAQEAISDGLVKTALTTKLSLAGALSAGGVAVMQNIDWLAWVAAATAVAALVASLFKILESIMRIWTDWRRHQREEQKVKGGRL